jgi:hypothetical protein
VTNQVAILFVFGKQNTISHSVSGFLLHRLTSQIHLLKKARGYVALGWVFSDEVGGTMAEIGLLPFARVALEVARGVLPAYRSRFSKRRFNQPQLLAVLCLMRYEDWTFREAEVRLHEHRELRRTLGLASAPDYTTLYRFLERLGDDTIQQALGSTVRRLHLPRCQRGSR